MILNHFQVCDYNRENFNSDPQSNFDSILNEEFTITMQTRLINFSDRYSKFLSKRAR